MALGLLICAEAKRAMIRPVRLFLRVRRQGDRQGRILFIDFLFDSKKVSQQIKARTSTSRLTTCLHFGSAGRVHKHMLDYLKRFFPYSAAYFMFRFGAELCPVWENVFLVVCFCD